MGDYNDAQLNVEFCSALDQHVKPQTPLSYHIWAKALMHIQGDCDSIFQKFLHFELMIANATSKIKK